MAVKALPDAELLRQLLDYDPETGDLTWRHRTPDMFESGIRSADWKCRQWNARCAGRPALSSRNGRGHRGGAIFGVPVYAHRVIWKIVHGTDPDVIDHIDGDGSNNSINNLRSVSQRINSRNLKLQENNQSGHAGVRKRNYKYRPWTAKISQKHLGSFATKDEAVAARRKAEDEMGFNRR